MIEKYYTENGEVGVIVSPGYGAGFSTWAHDKQICFDKDIIELVLNDDMVSIAKLMTEKYPNEYFGCSKLKVEFLEPGTAFRINEYDGFEDLVVINYPDDFMIA